MSALQWVLLILAIIAVVLVYLFSRRDRRAMENWQDEGETEEPLLPQPDQQLDIFSDGQFDEFGVGKPRLVTPRTEPEIGEPSGSSAEEQRPATSEARQARKLITLFVAEGDGGAIAGEKLHAALQAEGLEYGAHRVYHRMHEKASVFSVTNLVKPGHLDPAEAAGFSTPGIAMFMALPGPQRAVSAVHDMLVTAGRLADELDAQVYNGQRQPMTLDAGRDLQQEVKAWAQQNGIR